MNTAVNSLETLPEAQILPANSSHPILADVNHPYLQIYIGEDSGILVDNVRVTPIDPDRKRKIGEKIQIWCQQYGIRHVRYAVEIDYQPSWTNQCFDFAVMQYDVRSFGNSFPKPDAGKSSLLPMFGDIVAEQFLKAVYLFDVFPDPDAILMDRVASPIIMNALKRQGENDKAWLLDDTISSVIRHLKYGDRGTVTDFNIFGYSPQYHRFIHGLSQESDISNVYIRSPEFLSGAHFDWFKFDDTQCLLKSGLLELFTANPDPLVPYGDIIRAVYRTDFFNRRMGFFNRPGIEYKHFIGPTEDASKVSNLKPVSIYYGLLGLDQLETIGQRLDNRIHTGRCDRVYPIYKVPSSINQMVRKVPRSKGIKTTKVYLGNGKWKRVISD